MTANAATNTTTPRRAGPTSSSDPPVGALVIAAYAACSGAASHGASAAPAPVAAQPAEDKADADKTDADGAAKLADKPAAKDEAAAAGSAAAALPDKVKDSNPTCTDVPAFIPTQSMPEVDSKLCTSLNTKEPKNTFAYGTIDSTPEVVNELKEGKFATGEATKSKLKPANGTDIVIHKMSGTDLTVAYVIIDEDSFIQVNASQPGADIEAILKDAGFTA